MVSCPFLKDIFAIFKVELKSCLEVMRLVQYIKSAKEEIEMFQYSYTLDEEGRIENIFWCHAQSFEWYKKYGDVVVFYSTYNINLYDMPCAIFVGVR